MPRQGIDQCNYATTRLDRCDSEFHTNVNRVRSLHLGYAWREHTIAVKAIAALQTGERVYVRNASISAVQLKKIGQA